MRKKIKGKIVKISVPKTINLKLWVKDTDIWVALTDFFYSEGLEGNYQEYILEQLAEIYLKAINSH